MINTLLESRKIFYITFFIALVGLFFVGSFAIKRNFLPLIFLGSISGILYGYNLKSKKTGFRQECGTPFFFLLLTLCSWITASVFWGVNFASEFLTVVRFFADFILAWFVFKLIPTLSKEQGEILKRLLIIVFIGILLVGLVDITCLLMKGISARESFFRRNIILLLGLVWPVAYYIAEKLNGWKRSVSLSGLFIPLMYISFFGPMSTTAVAISAGLCSFILVRHTSRFFYIILAVTIFIFCIFLPIVFFTYDPSILVEKIKNFSASSWQHRIFIWSTVMDKFSISPVFGWGAEATRYINGTIGSSEATIYINNMPHKLSIEDLLPIHAHQGWFQIMMELGVVGLVLVISCWVQGAQQITASYKRQFPWIAATFFTLLVPFSISFGIWQTSWISIWLYSIISWRLVLANDKNCT